MADIPDDPESLTVPTLTSILSEHGIALPTKKEKKSFYVDLYTKELLNKEPSEAPARSTSVGRRRSSLVSPRRGRPPSGTGSTPIKELSAKSPTRGRSAASDGPALVSASRSPPPNITAPKLLQQVSLGSPSPPPRARPPSFLQQVTNSFVPSQQPPRTPTSPPKRASPSFSASTTFEGFTPVPPPAKSPTRSRDQSPPRAALYTTAPRRGSLSSSDTDSFSGSSFSPLHPKPASKYSPLLFVIVITLEIALVLFLAKYLALGSLLSFLVPPTTTYCNTYDSSSANCTACPPFAKCENGILKGCDAGYKLHRSGTSCIRDTDLDSKVSVLRDRMVELLAQRAGEVECKVREASDALVPDVEMREWARENVLKGTTEVQFNEIYSRVQSDARGGKDPLLTFSDWGRWSSSAPKSIPLWCRIEHFIMRRIFRFTPDQY